MSSAPEAETARWSDLLTRAHAGPLALVCLGVWLHAADGLLVATMMPAMVAEIGGEALVAWTIALYEIGTIVAGASSGFLVERHGIRRPMALAALLFGVGCIVAAIAPEMWIVLVGRLMQGLGGGGLMALAFVSAGQIFPRHLVARVMAAVSTLWGFSAFFGPLVGGLFVEYGTWRGGFWFFAAQAALLCLWVMTANRNLSRKQESVDSAGPGRDRFPVFRLLCLTAGVVAIAYAGIDITPLRTVFFVGVGLVLLWYFLRLDNRRPSSRLLPLKPFSLSHPVGAALVMIFCFSVGVVAIAAYGPLLMIHLHGISALSAGFILALESIGWTLAAVLVAGSPERHDPKFIALGMVMVAVSMVGLVHAVAHGPVLLIAFFATLEGAGFGAAWAFILRRVTALAPPSETSRVAASMPTMQRFGYAVGAAYVGIIANALGFSVSASPADMRWISTVLFGAMMPFAALGLLGMALLVLTRARSPVS